MKEPASLLYELLRLNSIKIDKKELEFQFKSHPSYPSLHSITGVLNHFGIENLAIEVPRNEETLNELPSSFIAHIKNKKGEHFVLVKQSGIMVELFFNKELKETISREAFFQFWTGIMVALEKSEVFIQEKGKNWYNKAPYLSGVIILMLVFFQNGISWFGLAHLLIAIVGAIVSVLIVQHELGVNSTIIDKFCSGDNEKSSCDDILNSKGAVIIGNIKFSDIGLVYFISVILSWILLSFVRHPNANLLIFLSLAALPFTLYSLIYQRFVVKKWCPLCLNTLIVLWAHGASLFLFKFDTGFYQINLDSISIILFSFIVVALLWIYLYPKFKLEHEHRKLKIDHNRFKRNYKIFEALIFRNPIIDTEIRNSFEIVLGAKDEEALVKEIVLVTNPLCRHCKSAHQAIVPLLNHKSKNIQVRLRFNVNIQNREAADVKIASRLLAIYDKMQEGDIIRALDEAYSVDSNTWLKKWDIDLSDKYFDELVKEKEWCRAKNINFTPEILLNGRSFPREYDRADLRYFIDDFTKVELEKKETFVLEFAS